MILAEAELFFGPRIFKDTDLDNALSCVGNSDREAFDELRAENLTTTTFRRRRIFEANRIEMREGFVQPNQGCRDGLFLQASRFNRSWPHNAYMQWKAAIQMVTIYAVKAIPRDAEIFVNFVGDVFSRSAERAIALGPYGRLCLCNTCTMRAESEDRWGKMARLNYSIANATLNRYYRIAPRYYVADVEMLLEGLDLEGLIYPGVAELYRKLSAWYCWQSRQLIDPDRPSASESFRNLKFSAVDNARKALRFALLTTGRESLKTREALDAIAAARLLRDA